MGRRTRWIVSVLVMAAVAVLLVWPWGTRPVGRGTSILDRWPAAGDPVSCAPCHAAIVAEWQADHHAMAVTNPERKEMVISKNFAPTDCNSCHAPAAIFEAGLGTTPPRREQRVAQGVDCLSCHQAGDGVASAKSRFRDAATDDVRAPCRPRYRAELADVVHCKTCHNQHLTVDQWAATRFGKPGPDFKSCLDCHMPAAEGPGTTGGPEPRHRSHRMPGAHDPATLRSAAVLTAARDPGSGDALIRVDTTACGHNFPTDYRTRFGLLVVEALDATGRVVAELARHKWRQPFRNEPGGSTPEGNTQIRGDAVHDFRIPTGEAGAVRVRLFYSLRPYNDAGGVQDFTTDVLAPDRLFLLHEQRLARP